MGSAESESPSHDDASSSLRAVFGTLDDGAAGPCSGADAASPASAAAAAAADERRRAFAECALADGSSFYCDACGGVVSWRRAAQHPQWCSGAGGGGGGGFG